MELTQPMGQKPSNMEALSSLMFCEKYPSGLLGSEEALLEQPSYTDSNRSKTNIAFNGVHNVWKDLGIVE